MDRGKTLLADSSQQDDPVANKEEGERDRTGWGESALQSLKTHPRGPGDRMNPAFQGRCGLSEETAAATVFAPGSKLH